MVRKFPRKFGFSDGRSRSEGDEFRVKLQRIGFLNKYLPNEEDESRRCRECGILFFHLVSCPLNEAAAEELAEYARQEKEEKEQANSKIVENCHLSTDAEPWLLESDKYPSSNVCIVKCIGNKLGEIFDRENGSVIENTETLQVQEFQTVCVAQSDDIRTMEDLVVEAHKLVKNGVVDEEEESIRDPELEMENQNPLTSVRGAMWKTLSQ
uniref:Uncharacterized protein n=2 Tax=Lygus hesperus TaxID=30085 RepID=A0A0K8T2Z3_LYGHE